MLFGCVDCARCRGGRGVPGNGRPHGGGCQSCRTGRDGRGVGGRRGAGAAKALSGACNHTDDSVVAEFSDDCHGDVAVDTAAGHGGISRRVRQIVFRGAFYSRGHRNCGGVAGVVYCAGRGDEGGAGEATLSQLEALGASGNRVVVDCVSERRGDVFCVVWRIVAVKSL